VARKKKGSAIDGRTTTWEGYGVSQRRRKVVEEPFGWLKTVGGLGKLLLRGLEKVRGGFTFAAAVFNLVRLKNLEAEPAPS
jgi:Transposase DDE domain